MRFSLVRAPFHLRSQKHLKTTEREEREESKKDEEIQKKPYPFAEDEGVVFFSIRLATKKEEL